MRSEEKQPLYSRLSWTIQLGFGIPALGFQERSTISMFVGTKVLCFGHSYMALIHGMLTLALRSGVKNLSSCGLWWMVDGRYPELSCFVKNESVPLSDLSEEER
jgi:hypothetical protein